MLEIINSKSVMKSLATFQVEKERQSLVYEVNQITQSPQADKCQEYGNYLEEECLVDVLHARMQSLGYQSDHVLKLSDNPDENRRRLLDRAKTLSKEGDQMTLEELKKGNIEVDNILTGTATITKENGKRKISVTLASKLRGKIKDSKGTTPNKKPSPTTKTLKKS